MYMMYFYLTLLMIVNLIPMIIYMTNMFISMMKKNNYEKNLPYECGYSPLSKPNLPFSLPFFMITLMFLIFDVEIIMLLPLIFHLINMNSMILLLTMITFIMSLILTLFTEWFFNFIKWLY